MAWLQESSESGAASLRQEAIRLVADLVIEVKNSLNIVRAIKTEINDRLNSNLDIASHDLAEMSRGLEHCCGSEAIIHSILNDLTSV